eukprot:scaffold157956_cov16-Prasinocladus_malaysianus.AAC.1
MNNGMFLFYNESNRSLLLQRRAAAQQHQQYIEERHTAKPCRLFSSLPNVRNIPLGEPMPVAYIDTEKNKQRPSSAKV